MNLSGKLAVILLGILPMALLPSNVSPWAYVLAEDVACIKKSSYYS